MIAAVCGGVRVVSLYAPNGRVVGLAVLPGQARLVRAAGALAGARRPIPTQPLVLGGDFNVAPDDADVWDPARLPRRHARLAAGARGLRAALRAGASSTPTACTTPSPGATRWWDYRAGNFHKNFGMRIDHLLVTAPVAERVVWAEIDREARKGKPIPSDHAPLVIDLDEPGRAFDAGWAGAESAHRQPPRSLSRRLNKCRPRLRAMALMHSTVAARSL